VLGLANQRRQRIPCSLRTSTTTGCRETPTRTERRRFDSRHLPPPPATATSRHLHGSPVPADLILAAGSALPAGHQADPLCLPPRAPGIADASRDVVLVAPSAPVILSRQYGAVPAVDTERSRPFRHRKACNCCPIMNGTGVRPPKQPGCAGLADPGPVWHRPQPSIGAGVGRPGWWSVRRSDGSFCPARGGKHWTRTRSSASRSVITTHGQSRALPPRTTPPWCRPFRMARGPQDRRFCHRARSQQEPSSTAGDADRLARRPP
jgi:hypothetical protein